MKNFKSFRNFILEQKTTRIIMLGGPGSGKSTYTEYLTKRYNIPHICPGGMMRTEIEKGTELGKQLSTILGKGNFAPNEIVLKLIKDRLAKPDTSNGFVLDGYPRYMQQVKDMQEMGIGYDFAVYLDVDREEVIRRLTARGRKDDVPEIINKRIDLYNKETGPAIEYFRNQPGFITIKAQGKDAELIANDIINEIEKKRGLSESIIDIPRRTYAPGVFDDADTENPKIKPSVKKLIDDQLKEFETEYPILKTGLIGSILTKRYRNDADLDINVLFDVPVEKQEEERTRLSKKYLSASNPDNIQGKEIPGTKHPINFYFITDKVTYQDQEDKADAVFDIENNKFIKRPEDFVFDMDLYLKDFERKVQEIDVVKGELKRDIIDYDELKELKPNEIENLSNRLEQKLDEIEKSIQDIVNIGDMVDAERRKAFDTDMSPEEIRTFGIKNRLPKNVIYKLLEKYYYIKFFKKCKNILDDGEVTDAEIDSLKTESVLSEAPEKHIAFTFGRFNPPTIGHEKLIDRVARVNANDYRIYVSKTQDAKKNPLSLNDKITFMKKMFPSHSRKILPNPTNMVLDILTDLYKQKATKITMVVGSDRVREFEEILTKYNDVKSRHGYYNFDKISVVSAGERDPDAEGAMGMSASKMRQAARANDFKQFLSGLPSTLGKSSAQNLFTTLRKKMNLAAGYGYMNLLGITPQTTAEPGVKKEDVIRDQYVTEQLFNVGDKVKHLKEQYEGIVVRRGTNYITIEDENNLLHKAWIYDLKSLEEKTEIPQDRDVKDKPGTQPSKYYKGLDQKTKEKRADYFKKQSTGNVKNDTPAPGDKDAKTKPSKYTIKYKQMYGENKMIDPKDLAKKVLEFAKEKIDSIKEGRMKELATLRSERDRLTKRMKDLKDRYNAIMAGAADGDEFKVQEQMRETQKSLNDVNKALSSGAYKKEAYEIGADYANHAKEITPGETPSEAPVMSKDRTPENSIQKKEEKKPENDDEVTVKDIKEWASSDETIDKYRLRYGKLWEIRLNATVDKMIKRIEK